ncbi:MAG: hypothetical protein QM781_03375 [Chitinophagaceae bacterium]
MIGRFGQPFLYLLLLLRRRFTKQVFYQQVIYYMFGSLFQPVID